MGEVEKPLHVRVAEALGWTAIGSTRVWFGLGADWDGVPPGHREYDLQFIPDYDTSWSATGPLVEKYGIMIQPCGRHMNCAHGWTALCLYDEEPMLVEEVGDSPLLAVCHLILALKEAGKLGA